MANPNIGPIRITLASPPQLWDFVDGTGTNRAANHPAAGAARTALTIVLCNACMTIGSHVAARRHSCVWIISCLVVIVEQQRLHCLAAPAHSKCLEESVVHEPHGCGGTRSNKSQSVASDEMGMGMGPGVWSVISIIGTTLLTSGPIHIYLLSRPNFRTSTYGLGTGKVGSHPTAGAARTA
jgi:hypothetical protein